MKKKYNILIATMAMNIGGAETHIIELAKGLKNKGFNIFVASNGGVYEKELTQNGIIHLKVPMHNKSVINIIKSFFLLKKIIKNYNIDLVHAHARIPGFIISLLYRLMKFPFLTTAHWSFDTGKGLKYFTDWGDKTIAVSEDLKYYLINNYNISPKKISLTINGINTDKFSPSVDCSDIIKEFNLNKNNKHLVSISRLDELTSNAALYLIRMMPEIIKTIKNIDLIIVGSGTKYSEVRSEAMAVNSIIGHEAVILTGGRTDINKFAVLSDLFVGISRSALEVMACNRPVILAGNRGYMGLFTPEKLDFAVLNNFTCRDAESLDYNVLKRDIINFFGMSMESIDEIARYGKSIVERYYSVERMVNDNVNEYINMIENPSFYMHENKLKSNYDLIILGYYGTRNSGDNAVLRSIIDNIKEKDSNIRILALSRNPKETRYEYEVDSIGIIQIFKIIKAMRNCKLFVCGGGSIIQDISSTRSILYYLSIILIANKMSLKIMLYANGIGPIHKKINRLIASKIINKVDIISLRDDLARQELTLLGIDKPSVYVSVDPVLSIKGILSFGIDKLKYLENIHGEGPYIGISVNKSKDFSQIYDSIVGLCEHIKAKTNGTIIFIPMYYSKDMPIIHKITRRMSTDVNILNNHYGVHEMMGIIGDLDFLIGMRLHALIYAAQRGVPMMGISYDPKVKGFMETINQTCIDGYENITTDVLIKEFDKNWDNRFESALKIKSMTSELREKAQLDVQNILKLIEE